MPSFSTGVPYFIPMPIVSDKALLTDIYPIVEYEDPVTGSSGLYNFKPLELAYDKEVMSGVSSISTLSLESQGGPIEKSITELPISGVSSLASIDLKNVLMEKEYSELAMSGVSSLVSLSLSTVLIPYSDEELPISGTSSISSITLTTP